MKSKILHEQDGQKTFVLVFNLGDEVAKGLAAFVERENISAAGFTAIGALENVILGYFDWQTKDYTRIPIKEQVEVLALLRSARPMNNATVLARRLSLDSAFASDRSPRGAE